MEVRESELRIELSGEEFQRYLEVRKARDVAGKDAVLGREVRQRCVRKFHGEVLFSDVEGFDSRVVSTDSVPRCELDAALRDAERTWHYEQ